MKRVVPIIVALGMVVTSCSSGSEAAATETALENIEANVVLTECKSESIGLTMTIVPDGWQCRVLNDPVSGLLGFTLFTDDEPDAIEITISTPSPNGRPCDVLVACDRASVLDLGTTFNVEVVEVGVPIIHGVHKTVDAELTVVVFDRLTDDDIAFVTMVLNGVEEI